MGLDPNDNDYEAGRRCALCEDVLFGGKTPKFVFASIKDVSACGGYVGPLPNGTWKLEQDPFLDCLWISAYPELAFWFKVDAPSGLRAWGFIGGFFRLFESLAVPVCSDEFVNGLVCGPPVNPSGGGGTGTVTWGPDIPCVN